MNLRDYLKLKDLTVPQFVDKVRDCGFDASVGAMRKWVRGDRIPRRDGMIAIEKATAGKVRAADFYKQDAA